MGKYSKEVQKLAITILGLITEGLGIGPDYLTNKMEEGMQVMVLNCYPPCPEPDLALGLPPHSDYSVLTILLQSSPGLQIWDDSNQRPGWKTVQCTRGVLQVNIGDHLEVLSNGLYRSGMHRAAVNSERIRISVVSLHSMGMDEKMETAENLVDENHPKLYNGSSFRDFLNFLFQNDILAGYKNFIDTVKIENVDPDIIATEN